MSFAITAHPRSGTMMLAKLLNTSSTWTVDHDVSNEFPGGYDDRQLIADHADRYHKYNGKYGCVSGNMLRVLDALPCDHKAIIIRDPVDIVLSNINKNPHLMTRGDFSAMCQRMNGRFDRIVKLLEVNENIRAIKFKPMVYTTSKLQGIVGWLGIDDVNTARLPEQINSSGQEHFTGVGSFGRFYLEQMEKFKPYIEYFGSQGINWL